MMKKPGFQSTQESTLPEIPPATDVDMIAYLRRSHKLAEIAALAERDALVLELCKQFDITVSEANAGEVVGPIQTKLGYHVLKVEKWFPAELNESARKDISESLFQNWLQNQGRLSPAGSR